MNKYGHIANASPLASRVSLRGKQLDISKANTDRIYRGKNYPDVLEVNPTSLLMKVLSIQHIKHVDRQFRELVFFGGREGGCG